jgi:hypothetical protein
LIDPNFRHGFTQIAPIDLFLSVLISVNLCLQTFYRPFLLVSYTWPEKVEY